MTSRNLAAMAEDDTKVDDEVTKSEKNLVQCPICQDEKPVDDMATSDSGCGHMVCWKCYGEAFKSSAAIMKCPLCRDEFTKKPVSSAARRSSRRISSFGRNHAGWLYDSIPELERGWHRMSYYETTSRPCPFRNSQPSNPPPSREMHRNTTNELLSINPITSNYSICSLCNSEVVSGVDQCQICGHRILLPVINSTVGRSSALANRTETRGGAGAAGGGGFGSIGSGLDTGPSRRRNEDIQQSYQRVNRALDREFENVIDDLIRTGDIEQTNLNISNSLMTGEDFWAMTESERNSFLEETVTTNRSQQIRRDIRHSLEVPFTDEENNFLKKVMVKKIQKQWKKKFDIQKNKLRDAMNFLNLSDIEKKYLNIE